MVRRIIMSPDRGDYLFLEADYDKGTDYYEDETPIEVKELNLSTETEKLVKEWHRYFLDNLNDDFSFSSDLARHNFEQLGMFLYQRVLEEVKGRHYVVYSPYSSVIDLDYPVIVDENKETNRFIQVALILGWVIFLGVCFWYSKSHF